MTNKLALIVLIIFASNMSYGQSITISQDKIGPKLSAYPPLYILDGLKMSQERFAQLKLTEQSIKRINVDERPCIRDSVHCYCGVITIKSKLLIVLNDRLLTESKDKEETLSKINTTDILSVRLLDKKEALSKYGKNGQYGALIINL